MDFLEIKNVFAQIGNNSILQDISFSVSKQQKLAIAGVTGSGKSTLLKIIGGIISPQEGEVWFEGEKLKRIPEEKLIPGHPGIAWLSQQSELPNHYRMEELISYANTGTDREALYICALCRVKHLLKRKATELSGGEKQRLALARLLVSKPRLLVLDEPYSNLDMIHKAILKRVLDDITLNLDLTSIMVSHEPKDCLPWADEIIILNKGRIVQRGSPKRIYHTPADEYTAGLMGKYNLMPTDTWPADTNDHLIEGKLFLRPEDIIALPYIAGKDSCLVEAVHFCGDHDELDIIGSSGPIVISCREHQFSRGDIVSLKKATKKEEVQ